MGRKKLGAHAKSVIISVRLEPWLAARLRHEAARRGRSISEIARCLLREFCNTFEGEKKDD